jgi:hypothetical protein
MFACFYVLRSDFLHSFRLDSETTASWLASFAVRIVNIIKFLITYIIVRIYACDYRRGMDWMLYLLTTCTHHSELPVIIALSLISILYKSPQHSLSLFPACCVFNRRFLATASNSGDSSASRAHIVIVRWTPCNWTLVNCQLNYSATSSQPTLQSSTQLPTLNWTLSLTNQLLYFTQLKCTHPSWGPRYIISGWIQQETLPSTILLLLLWAVA